MSLFETVEHLANAGGPEICLDRRRCLHSFNKAASCSACSELCPAAAIQPGKPPALNPQACVVCRACLPACPVGAYSGEDKVKGLLSCAARAVEKYKVTRIDLLCDRLAAPTQGPPESALGLRVEGCLAQLGAGAYLALFGLGIETVTVRLDECARCALGSLQAQCERQVEQARALASPWGLDGRLAILDRAEGARLRERPGWNAAAPPLSRADLLHPATLWSESQTPQLIAVDAPAAGRQRLSLDRCRQNLAFQHLLAGEQPARDNLTARIARVRAAATEACTGCGVCSQACPTGALQRTVIDEADGAVRKEFQLSFAPLKCVDCQICTALCPEDALSLESPVQVGYLLEEEIVLRRGSFVKCRKCNTFFSPRAGEKLCPLCQFRREHPFGSRQPQVKNRREP